MGERPIMECAGCGNRDWQTDAELVAARKDNPQLIACCPERRMRPIEVGQIIAWLRREVALDSPALHEYRRLLADQIERREHEETAGGQ